MYGDNYIYFAYTLFLCQNNISFFPLSGVQVCFQASFKNVPRHITLGGGNMLERFNQLQLRKLKGHRRYYDQWEIKPPAA